MSPYPRPSPQQRFVYGTFLWPTRRTGSAFFGAESGEPDIAIAIIREFSATEFVGKLYINALGDWVVAQFPKIQQMPWFKGFERFPDKFAFDMQGAGPWKVLHLRAESDEFGSYVAVALREEFEKGKLPTWIKESR